MANKVQLKRSAVPGKVPATTDLDLGEIAINTYDGKAYIKKNVSGTESIVPLGGAGSGDVTGPNSSTDNAIARFDGASGKIIQNSTGTIDDSGNASLASLSLTTDLAVTHGGTGASTAADARTNLGAQATLVSGTNIKTINSTSLLGSGNIAIPTGDVVGPASATDNAIARFDATTGKLIQSSGGSIDDNGNLTSLTQIASGTGANKIPVGTTAQRPASPQNGEVRVNTDRLSVPCLEFYDGTQWVIAASAQEFFLTKFPGAAAAYSLRDLNGTGGNVIRVRRSSDNVETNFTADQISAGSVTTFVGAGNNGFVTTWYDQSGNGVNLIQTTSANQPQIVLSGSLVLKNGKPAMQFDGVNDALFNTSFFDAGSLSVLSVAEFVDTASGVLFIIPTSTPATTAVQELGFWNAGGYFKIQFNQNSTSGAGGIGANGSLSNLAQQILSFAYTGGSAGSTASYVLRQNGSALALAAGGALGYASEFFAIGRRTQQGINAYSGKVQEVIVYASDTASSFSNMEQNINSHYGVF